MTVHCFNIHTYSHEVCTSIWKVYGTAGTNIDIRMFTERNETENSEIYVYLAYISTNRYVVNGELTRYHNGNLLYTQNKNIDPVKYHISTIFTCSPQRNPWLLVLLEACRPWWASQISRQRCDRIGQGLTGEVGKFKRRSCYKKTTREFKRFNRFESEGRICLFFLNS